MRFSWAVFIVFASAACAPELQTGPDVYVSCKDDGVCPQGLTCLNGARCVALDRVDANGPTPVLPSMNSVIRDSGETTFLWQPVSGASSYTLTVATDDGFTQIAGSAETTATTASVPLPAGTYVWRVSSDVTDPAAKITPVLFGILGEALFVYCAPEENCASPGVLELGTAAQPYRSITRAMNAALSLEDIEVRVAMREPPYAEPITLPSGITIVGGYSSTFVPGADGARTAIAVAGTSFLAAGVSNSSVAHFDFTNTTTDGVTSTVARIIESSQSLVLTDVGLHAVQLADYVLRVESGRDATGPRIVDSRIDAVHPLETPVPQAAYLINIAKAGALRLENTVVYGRWDATGNTMYAIEAVGGQLELARCTIDLVGPSVVYGIHSVTPDGVPAQSLMIRDSTIAVRGGLGAYGAFGLGVRNPSSFVLDRSTVVARGAPYVTGIELLDVVRDASVTNSVVLVDAGTLASTAIRMNDVADVLVAGSTIGVGSTPSGEVGIDFVATAHARLVNNVFITLATKPSDACAGDQCRVAVIERTLDGATALANNRFIGYATSGGSVKPTCAYAKSDGTCLTDLNASWNLTNPFSSGNAILANAGAAGLKTSAGLDGVYATADDDFHLNGTQLAGAGYDPTSNDCHAQANNGFPMPACGGLSSDRENKQRPNPPAIGAYEP